MVEVGSKLIKFTHLLIYNSVFIEEVYVDSVLSVDSTMVCVAHCEVALQLLLEVALELFSIAVGDKTIMEDAQNLVCPELNDVLLVFVEVLVGQVNSLEHF